MPLKAYISSLDEVDEKYHDLYEQDEDGDGYILSIEDKDYKKKLDEFRTNNRERHREIQRLKKEAERFKDIDPEEYQRAMEALSKIEDDDERRLLKEGKHDEVVERRVSAMRKDFDSQRKALEKARDDATVETTTLRSELGRLKIDEAIATSLEKLKVKVRPGAQEDVKARTRRVWKINADAKMVPGEGSDTVYGKDGEPITMDEFAQNLFDTAPFLFEGSGGGDAGGGDRKPARRGEKEITAGDPLLFGKHLEGIASGKVKVRHD